MQINPQYRYKKNPTLNRGSAIFKDKRDAFWYSGSLPSKPTKETYRDAEQLGKMILEKEGFINIKYTASLLGERFPFDYIAEKNDKKYAIEITCGQRKEQTSRLLNSLEIFNLDIIYIFIKPDFSVYFISNPEDKRRCWWFSDCQAKSLFHSGNVNPYISFFSHIISPFNFDNLQQISYDLTLFRVYEIQDGGSIKNGKTILPKYLLKKPRNDVYSLEAHKTYSFDFCEKVQMPSNMYGMIYPRSSSNRIGVLITSGIYDPGFTNRVGAIARVTQNVELKKFDRVATLLISWADSASEYNGQYQGEGLKKEFPKRNI